MAEFRYTPDREQKVHGPGAISLICRPFQSHETGIPEWAKNSSDEYSREDAPADKRIIVLIFDDRVANGSPKIGCLDFGGTTSEKIEKYFRHWASPDAAHQGLESKVLGGHGNGGKCYMTQMFSDHAIFHTVKDGVGCKYGVAGGSVQFGYVPDAKSGRNFSVENLRRELDKALHPFGISTKDLPKPALSALTIAQGFTLVSGAGPKYFEKKIRVKELLSQIREHPQMLIPVEYCDVYAMYNANLLDDFSPLYPSAITPISGAEEGRSIDIPEYMIDPSTEMDVSTTDQGKTRPGQLILNTSDVSMRWKKKYRHTINYQGRSGFVGFKSMLEFPVQSGYRDQIYGTCELESLERYKKNERAELAESPLTRAVDHFIAEQVEKYAEEFESRDKKAYSKKERNALSVMNEALDRWKNQFLRDYVQGAFGPGGGGPTRDSLPTGRPTRIEVSVTYPKLGIGVAIRPTIRFFDVRGVQIRPVPFRWVSEDTNVALVDDELMIINSFSPGETIIYAETASGNLQSNRVPLRVVKIRSIRIDPVRLEVAEGSRGQLRAVCNLSDNTEASDVALIWTESNPTVARVSAAGLVYGASPGETDVSAGDDRVISQDNATVTVTEGEEKDGKGRGAGKGGRGAGRNQGRGYPLVLVSGEVDRDPDTDEYVHLSADIPPIYQRPQDFDRNIWWINSSSPLARMYLDNDLGYGYDSREWRMYHLERYMEIITQIAMVYDPNITGPLPVGEYFLYSADKAAEIQSAVARELAEFVRDGSLPSRK